MLSTVVRSRHVLQRLVAEQGGTLSVYLLSHHGVKTRPEAPPGKGKDADEKQRQFSRRSSTNFDTLGSWNYRMELDVDLEQSIKAGTIIPELRLDKIGVASLLGRRKDNEDRYYYGRLTEDIVMFAIYDGHGGALAAEYVKENMVKHIMVGLEKDDRDLMEVLRSSFLDVHNAFARFVYHNYAGRP